jgi:hypothetical protein
MRSYRMRSAGKSEPGPIYLLIVDFHIPSEPAMFVRIDHVMICVPDLQQGIAQYRRMGFNIHAGGIHTGKGTHNAIALNQEDYIELLAIRDPAEYRIAAKGTGSWVQVRVGPPQHIDSGK